MLSLPLSLVAGTCSNPDGSPNQGLLGLPDTSCPIRVAVRSGHTNRVGGIYGTRYDEKLVPACMADLHGIYPAT